MFPRSAALAFALLFLLTGCAPSISPLYRDYEVRPVPIASAEAPDAEAVAARLRAALTAAGWEVREPVAGNVLPTESRQLSNWGLYRVLVSLDAVPIGEHHVRVQFHPTRRYFTGGRSKISYLNNSLRRALLPGLNAALEAHGFLPLGTPAEQDEDHVEGT